MLEEYAKNNFYARLDTHSFLQRNCRFSCAHYIRYLSRYLMEKDAGILQTLPYTPDHSCWKKEDNLHVIRLPNSHQIGCNPKRYYYRRTKKKNHEFLIAICRQSGDELQSKTLF